MNKVCVTLLMPKGSDDQGIYIFQVPVTMPCQSRVVGPKKKVVIERDIGHVICL